MTEYQLKQIADKIVGEYLKAVNQTVGFYITRREQEQLIAFTIRLLELRGRNVSVDYVKSVYYRAFKNCNSIVGLCATEICHVILNFKI